jgi:hypothetical protein
MAETARAYLYSGEWTADCPREGCANAEYLHGLRRPGRPAGPGNPRDVRKPSFLCSYCQQAAVVEWPPQAFMDAVVELLNRRPVPSTRNWYPADHAGAVGFRIEHGQTLEQLREESREHGLV